MPRASCTVSILKTIIILTFSCVLKETSTKRVAHFHFIPLCTILYSDWLPVASMNFSWNREKSFRYSFKGPFNGNVYKTEFFKGKKEKNIDIDWICTEDIPEIISVKGHDFFTQMKVLTSTSLGLKWMKSALKCPIRSSWIGEVGETLFIVRLHEEIASNYWLSLKGKYKMKTFLPWLTILWQACVLEYAYVPQKRLHFLTISPEQTDDTCTEPEACEVHEISPMKIQMRRTLKDKILKRFDRNISYPVWPIIYRNWSNE